MHLLQILGRFHLVVLHLPIGFLLLAFLMEIMSRTKESPLRPAVRFTLFWGMLSAVAAAGLGYLLAGDGSYDEEVLGWHKWLGFVTAGLAAGLYFTNFKKDENPALRKIYLPLFSATILALIATGHLGGTLTHGSGFLFENPAKNEAETPAIANIDSAEVFAEIILPVFKNKCTSCHNPSKKKGGLSLTDKAEMLKGGDLGPLVNLSKPAESPLLSINLPIEDKYHMPPKSKKQLTPHEKQLLEWWANAGGPVDKKVADCNMPEDLKAVLVAQQQRKISPLHVLKLEPVSDGTLASLQKDGIKVFPLAQGSPFLEVQLSGRKDLSPSLLKKLKKTAGNIVHLNCSNSNMDDDMLAVVKDLPHLNRLYLAQTLVSDKGLAHLSKLDFLEYLNLYKTKVTDKGLASLKGLKNLKSVYLWQTEVTDKGVAMFASGMPEMVLNKGVENDSLFGDVALKPPVIEAGKELFTDTVLVTLKSGLASANVYYTLDGSDPDSMDALYEKPLILNATGQLKAVIMKEGWTTSEIASRQFVKIRYQPKEVKLAKAPNPKYAGEGGKTLADLKKGKLNFGAGGWIGYQGQHMAATLDLGKVTDVSGVTVGTLENTGSWIFFPKGLRISTSTDGKIFKKAKETTYPTAAENTKPTLKNITESFKTVNARYVKVEVLNNLKNPSWHPSPGEPCWVFVDEILVE